jgi:hypothetical protein
MDVQGRNTKDAVNSVFPEYRQRLGSEAGLAAASSPNPGLYSNPTRRGRPPTAYCVSPSLHHGSRSRMRSRCVHSHVSSMVCQCVGIPYSAIDSSPSRITEACLAGGGANGAMRVEYAERCARSRNGKCSRAPEIYALGMQKTSSMQASAKRASESWHGPVVTRAVGMPGEKGEIPHRARCLFTPIMDRPARVPVWSR